MAGLGRALVGSLRALHIFLFFEKGPEGKPRPRRVICVTGLDPARPAGGPETKAAGAEHPGVTQRGPSR